MLRFAPMRGLAPDPSLADRVNAVPYDVVDTREARALAAGNPLSLLHVDRAEMDLPDGTDPHADVVYRTAREAFDRLVASGALVREPRPVVYVYRLTAGAHTQRGLVGLCHVDDYAEGRIKRHENTRRDKEDDRARLIATLRAQTGPVFLAYRDDAALAARMDEAERGAPRYDVVAPDGVRHTVFRVDDPAALVREASALDAAYIADGHHRAASALRVSRELCRAEPATSPDDPRAAFLAVMFPASELRVLPYHRVVRDLGGLDAAALLEAARRVVRVESATTLVPEGPRHARMYLDGRAFDLAWDVDPDADPVARLDVSVLQDRLLAPVLGIADPRTSPRIDFVGGIRGPDELVRRVDAGDAAVAFAMHATTVDEMMAIADAGRIMPPKSTWFEPKLRSGFFVHTF